MTVSVGFDVLNQAFVVKFRTDFLFRKIIISNQPDLKNTPTTSNLDNSKNYFVIIYKH